MGGGLRPLTPEEAALRVRKWTPAERQSVIDLREKGKGPVWISKQTSIPLDQVKFWIYGPRGSRRSKRSPNDAENSKRGYYRTKYKNWFQWRASTFVSSSRARLRKLDRPPQGPRPAEVQGWIEMFFPGECAYCRVALVERTFSIDHAQPLSRNGNNTFENFRAVCSNCNAAKGSMTEAEFEALMALLATWEDGGKNLRARLRSAGMQFKRPVR